MVKISLVTQTYKRPQYAERLLDLVEHHTPFVDNAVVGYITEDEYEPQERDWQVDWVSVEGLNLMEGRNFVASKADEKYDTDILWITDDDVKPNEHTDFRSVLPKVMANDTGVVAITRQMGGNDPQDYDDTLRENLPYIGGGYLIEPHKFSFVDGFDEDDASDEKAFTFKLYLRGFVNYRTRKAYAVHEQDAGEGGLRQSLEEGNSVQGSDLVDNPLIEIEEGEAVYGENTRRMAGSGYKLSDEAQSLHRENNKVLNNE